MSSASGLEHWMPTTLAAAEVSCRHLLFDAAVDLGSELATAGALILITARARVLRRITPDGSDFGEQCRRPVGFEVDLQKALAMQCLMTPAGALRRCRPTVPADGLDVAAVAAAHVAAQTALAWAPASGESSSPVSPHRQPKPGILDAHVPCCRQCRPFACGCMSIQSLRPEAQ
jgi:hypothetical protein